MKIWVDIHKKYDKEGIFWAFYHLRHVLNGLIMFYSCSTRRDKSFATSFMSVAPCIEDLWPFKCDRSQILQKSGK